MQALSSKQADLVKEKEIARLRSLLRQKLETQESIQEEINSCLVDLSK